MVKGKIKFYKFYVTSRSMGMDSTREIHAAYGGIPFKELEKWFKKEGLASIEELMSTQKLGNINKFKKFMKESYEY